jgi:hypothetical protein
VRSLSWQNYPRKKKNNYSSMPRMAIGRMNWIHLDSLGIEPKEKKELNDKEELENLSDNIKQAMFQDYKLAYSEKGDAHTEEAESTITVG